MSDGKKPGDETMKVPPGLVSKKPTSSTTPALKGVPIDAPPTDSFVGRMKLPSSSHPQLSEVPSGPQKIITGETAPEVSQGEPGKPLTVQMQPKLFYAELSGNCLWTRV